MQQSPRLLAIPDLKPRENEAVVTDGLESGVLQNWTQFGDRAQSGEGACRNCCILNLVSTRCVSSVPCPIAVAMMFHVHRLFRLRKIRVFQTCLVENPSVKVVYFENHAEWRFCVLLPLCVVLCWRAGALSRSVGAVAPERVVPSLFVFPCVYLRASVEHSS